MGALKRKESSSLRLDDVRNSKKAKVEKNTGTKKRAQRQEGLEAETDSDPIVESDTASQSGEGDGASWPSDGADEVDGEDEEWDGVSEGDDQNGGGVEISSKASRADQPVMKSPSTDPKNLSSSSRESHAKQKIMAQERRAAKPNADSVAQSKKLWERLRRKSHVPLDERKKLIAQLFEIITGHVKDFVFKHDSVRVIQTALKYANVDQRKMIAQELKGEYKQLAESKYAKFLVGKMLVHGDGETRDLVVPEFYGSVRKMIKHPEASWILDDIYRGIATPSQKATLLREWYGAEFAIFKPKDSKSTSADLTRLLAQTPEKRTPIMRSLYELINLLVQKKSTGFTMLHDAMLQYFLNTQPGSEEATEYIELLKGDEQGDLLKNLAFTKSGARLVCLALAYGNAKDRKHILRTFKGTIQDMSYDKYGHQVLLTVYDVLDDTVLVSKSVFPELVGKEQNAETKYRSLLSDVTHLNARISLLYLFSGKSKAIIPEEDLTLLDEVHRIRTTSSKKDPEVRRKELVSSLSPNLLSLIANSPESLVETSFGCQFVTEVLLGATGDKDAAIVAIASLVKRGEETQDLLNTPAAGRMLKSLASGGKFNPKTKSIDPVDPPLTFHDAFFTQMYDEVADWASGSNSFVIVGLLEAPGFQKKVELKQQLERHRSKLVEAASTQSVSESSQKKTKAKIENGRKSMATGNAGSRIILAKLDKERQ